MIIENQKNSKIIGNGGAIIYDLLNPTLVENQIRYSLLYVSLSHGKSTLSHVMKKSEVYYILNGKGMLYINNKPENVKVEDTVFVMLGSKQHIKNIGSENLKFLCMVDPAWKKDDETIL